LLPFRLPRPS